MSIAVAILFAAVSPLASPSDYVFAPFTNNENAAAFIKGEIMGADADYVAIRAEDFAFLQEAFAERAALANGSWATTTSNATESLKIGDWHGWFINPNGGLWKYLQSDSGLPSGRFMCDYYKAVTNVSSFSWLTMNVIGRTVTATTNWVYGGTNSFRADWPALAAMQIIPVTNYTYAVTNEWRTNVSHMAWMDCITTNESVFARPNMSISQGGWRLYDQIPEFAAVTNMYGTLALGKYLLREGAQYDSNSNRYGNVTVYRDYWIHYNDVSTDRTKIKWVDDVYGPTSRVYAAQGNLPGSGYELSGYAYKTAAWSSYWSGDELIYEMSPTEISEYSTEKYPSNNNAVAELIISHVTVDVATRGLHTRIKNPVRLYHPFKLDYSETIGLVTPTADGDDFTNLYNKAGTAYGMACTEGYCDFSGDDTNRVTITSEIAMKPMFEHMAGAVGIRYTTPASISVTGLPDPRDASYEHHGQTVHDNTTSYLSVEHVLSLVGAPIILYECDFSADVN